MNYDDVEIDENEQNRLSPEGDRFPVSSTIVTGVLARLGLDRRPASPQVTLEDLERQLDDDDWQVRLRAVRLLRWQGEPSTRALVKAASDQKEIVRVMARYILQLRTGKVVRDYTLSCIEENNPKAGIEDKNKQKQFLCETKSWRGFIRETLKDQAKKESIARLLQVEPELLEKWVVGSETPQQRQLLQLVNVLPGEKEGLFHLIKKEFPDFAVKNIKKNDIQLRIPDQFYQRVDRARMQEWSDLRFWSVCQLVLQQIIQQLDPYRQGTIATLMICTVPSAGNVVRSLHGYMGRGNSGWVGSWYQFPIFFGSESLSGYVTSHRKSVVIRDVRTDLKETPIDHIEGIRSVLVMPICDGEKIAGCLYIGNSAPDYFPQERQELVRAYAQVLAHAFEPEEFYTSDALQLRIFPPQTMQEQYFVRTQQKARSLFIHEQYNEKTKSMWQALEEEALKILDQKHERPIKGSSPLRYPVQIKEELSSVLGKMTLAQKTSLST